MHIKLSWIKLLTYQKKVYLLLFDKNNFLQLANPCSIFSTILFHTNLNMKEESKGKPKYIIGKASTLQPRRLARSFTSCTSPTSTNRLLAMLIFRSEIASKQRTQCKYFIWSRSMSQKIRVSTTNKNAKSSFPLEKSFPLENHLRNSLLRV